MPSFHNAFLDFFSCVAFVALRIHLRFLLDALGTISVHLALLELALLLSRQRIRRRCT